MLQIGDVQLGHVPRVVLSVCGDSALLRCAAWEGVDLIEARVDQFRRLDVPSVARDVRAIARHGLPVIGTVRSHQEGGRAELKDTQRLALFAALVPVVDAVDVELGSPSILAEVIALTRRHRKTLLVSSHHFTDTPPDSVLEGVLERARSLRADLVKIAAFARRPHDVERLLRFTFRHKARHLVTIAMGAQGTISRLVFPLAGSLLTYTHVSPSMGQIPLRAFVKGLRLCYPDYEAALLRRRRALERRPATIGERCGVRGVR